MSTPRDRIEAKLGLVGPPLQTVRDGPPAIPDHELVRRIGQGAYGEVWLARTALGTWRAVKIVYRDNFKDARPYEREFAGIRRFEPLSRTNEGFVDILQVGRDEADGWFYYVMELADDVADTVSVQRLDSGLQSKGTAGPVPPQPKTESSNLETYTSRTLSRDLHQRLRLPLDECLELGLTLSLALGYLHRHGLIHRDVKPSNIIFVRGVPKLADIGLVTEAAGANTFVGTEGFVPPEGPTSPQADIYALGKVLYETAMGKDRNEFPEPFTRIGTDRESVALMELNTILLRACAPDPKKRYGSAEEMHADLALLHSGGSVKRRHQLDRQFRIARQLGAAAIAASLLFGAAWFWQQQQTGKMTRLAEEKATLATEKTTLADNLSKLGEDNRQRIVRLNIANGVREMDQGNTAQALVWLSEALALTTTNPADSRIQRTRIHQLLARHPRLLHVLPHPANVPTAEFSRDERSVVTGCVDGLVRIWEIDHDEKPLAEFRQDGPVGQVRFTHNGQHLFVTQLSQLKQLERVSLLDAATGLPVFQPVTDLTAAALSPDGRWLAVARTNARIDLISTDTGQVLSQAVGHEARIEMLSFNADSSQLLTASRDHTVRRWDVGSGKPIGPPLLHSQSVVRAVFNGDASRIATATASEGAAVAIQFQTWVAASGTALGKPIPGVEFCSVLAFDPAGRSLLTGDGEGIARLWDADSHTAILPPLQLGGNARSFDFGPDGARVALGTGAGTTWIWDTETGSQTSPQLHSVGSTECVRFNPAGSRLLTASDDGTVKIWDLTQVPDDGLLRVPAYRSEAVVSPDGLELLLGIMGEREYVQLVKLESLNEAGVSIPFYDAIHPRILTFDRNGHQWAAAPGPPSYEDLRHRPREGASVAGLWRREGNQIHYHPLPHADRLRGVYFHEDGRQVLTAGDDRMTRIWNAADGSLREAISWSERDIAWVAVSPDLRTAIVLFRDENGRHMLFRDLKTGKNLGSSAENNPDISAATFSPDGTRVGTVGENQCCRIWDPRSGQPLTPFFKHGGALTCVEWSPDGRQVVTAGLSPEVKIWDAATGELALPPLMMKSSPVEGARFSADGRFIVAFSEDKLARVWDSATGEAVTPFLRHQDYVSAAFVTATPQLATVSRQCVVRVWDLKETGLSATDLSDYARLLAGNSSRHLASPTVAGPEELAALLRSLRVRQPGLFAASPDRLQAWHRREAQDPNTLGRLSTALFHLERLARLAPDDPTILEQMKRRHAAQIPARDPGTPPQLIDLSRAYTHSFELVHPYGFSELPRGRHKLGGIEFDLRGIVQLDHRSERANRAGPFHPAAIIRIGQHCRALNFLQASEGDPRLNGSTVARWIIHYTDGSTREWPVIYGEHLGDLWWLTNEEPLDTKQATIVWRGHTPRWNPIATDGVRLFKASWTNPQPDLEIDRLEYRIGETALKPFVVAITAE